MGMNIKIIYFKRVEQRKYFRTKYKHRAKPDIKIKCMQ